MTHNVPPKTIRNTPLRNKVFDILDALKPGDTITSRDVVNKLRTRLTQPSPFKIANMMRERKDFRNSKGVWEKI